MVGVQPNTIEERATSYFSELIKQMFSELLLSRVLSLVGCRKRKVQTRPSHCGPEQQWVMNRTRGTECFPAGAWSFPGTGSRDGAQAGRMQEGGEPRLCPGCCWGAVFSVITNQWAALPTVSSPFKSLFLPFQCFLLFPNKDLRKGEIHREK